VKTGLVQKLPSNREASWNFPKSNDLM